MCAFEELTHFAALDWAMEHHDVLVLDRQGAEVTQFRFEDTAEGWAHFREKVRALLPLGVAIETSAGCVVERLLNMGCRVFPVNPAAAKKYRERLAPSGGKSDTLDCRSLAQALRLEGRNWRPLRPADPVTQELRLLCRDEVELITQRTALVNQLRAGLHEYYPAALEAFSDWTHTSAWDFVLQFPTPEALREAGPRRWQKFLHSHRLARPGSYEKRLQLFAHATDFCGSKPVTSAKSLLVATLAKTLRLLTSQLDEYHARIQALYNQHPDRDWFGSLPVSHEGKAAPRLLAELGSDPLVFSTVEGLQCFAGSAPVRYQSGKTEHTHMRRACNKHLRYALHWFADLTRAKCPWAEAYYRKKIEEGKSHAWALRCLAQRWLKIIWKMWNTHTCYDPELHQRNQLQHGSWVLQLLPSAASPSTPVKA